MSTHVLNIPKLTESEASKMADGARHAFAGHPMDDFMARTFRALKQRRERKSKFQVQPKKGTPQAY